MNNIKKYNVTEISKIDAARITGGKSFIFRMGAALHGAWDDFVNGGGLNDSYINMKIGGL